MNEFEHKTPAWALTFADLMSILLCFFVLLFSASEIDVEQYKDISDSLTGAFNTKDKIDKIKELKLDASIVKQKISNKQKLKAENIAMSLAPEIQAKLLEVDVNKNTIIIRLMANSSFTPNSATVKPILIPVINKISEVLSKATGNIDVVGHTDDSALDSVAYQSNWDLSSARASSVTNVLLSNKLLKQNRFKVVGLGSTSPIVDNTNNTNRLYNRRVEIILY